MRYIDAMQMNMTKIQAEVQRHPLAIHFLINEWNKCRAWVATYQQVERELAVLRGESA